MSSPNNDGELNISIGSRVEGNYRAKGKWYPGTVTKICDDGSCDISYDDGESESRVHESCIRLLESNHDGIATSEPISAVKPLAGTTLHEGANGISVGSRVEGNYHDFGFWLHGSVTNIRENGNYDVAYDDGSSQLNMHESCIRLQESVLASKSGVPLAEPSVSKEARSSIAVGSRVQGNYRSKGKWYPGTVTDINNNDGYDIEYDDGESELHVHESCIRLLEMKPNSIGINAPIIDDQPSADSTNCTNSQQHLLQSGTTPQAEFDVFISYRQSTDYRHAEILDCALTAAGLKVWRDVHPGKTWDEGFSDGVLKSCCCCCLLSKNAINNPIQSKLNLAQMTVDSPCDNMLLQFGLACELQERNLLRGIFPVYIGDTSDDVYYSNYFSSGCHPRDVPDIVVNSLATQILQHLEYKGLGMPLNSSPTVAGILKGIVSNQGYLFQGNLHDAVDQAVKGIREMVTRVRNPGVLATTSVSAGKFAVGSRVEGNYRAKGKWYPGTVINIYDDVGSYDILYNDGESEMRVHESCIRLLEIIADEIPSSESQSAEPVVAHADTSGSKGIKTEEVDKLALQRALKRGKKEWGRSKIMIVGEGRAGKTALANSIIGKPYQNTNSTIGINQITCDVKFATIGDGNNGEWGEFSRPGRELEAALAQMIVNEGQSRTSTGQKLIPVGSAAPTQFDDLINHSNGINNVDNCNNIQGDSFGSQTGSKEHLQYAGATNSIKVTTAQASATSAEADSFEVTKPEQLKASSLALAAGGGSSVDNELVMKCLANGIQTNTKFIISVFDFGGQSVFNVIHPFFLTRYGVYLLVFNMEWLVTSDETERLQCLSYLKFWVNSVVIHTLNDNNITAPIVLVGTRKDIISNPQDHQRISTVLYETFHSSIAWPHVLENNEAEGVNGAIDLYFFPVDNTQSRNDPSMKKLLKIVEQRIDASDYVHEEKPLSWLQTLDQMTASGESYLSFDRVVELAASCDVPREEVPILLGFFHQLGMLMWHDDVGLRNVIILDPVEYFVKPATIVICKHAPNSADGVYHSLDIHKTCKKNHNSEFNKMIDRGIVGEILLRALLAEYSQQYDQIVHLMIKYGLLVPLATGNTNSATILTQSGNSYLAPALLPEGFRRMNFSNIYNGIRDEWTEKSFSSFYFIFSASNELEQQTTLTATDLREQGFLPSGLFERLICKAVNWSQQTTDSFLRMEVQQLTKNEAILCYGNQRFRLTLRIEYSCVQVDVEGVSALAVHQRLQSQLEKIIVECMKSLRFFTSLPYVFDSLQPPSTSDKDLLLIRLQTMLASSSHRSALSIISGHGARKLLGTKELEEKFGAWLQLDRVLSQYDVFLSYRWGPHDSMLTQALFDRMTLYTMEPNHRPIAVFLDTHRLKDGRSFQQEFSRALCNSSVVVPIVSVDSLIRMTDHNPNEEDNVLVEWLCTIACQRVHARCSAPTCSTRVRCVLPIFLGAIGPNDSIANIFDSGLFNKLPKICPTASLQLSLKLLRDQQVDIDDLLPYLESLTVLGIVDCMKKYLSICAWQYGTVPAAISPSALKIYETLLSSSDESREVALDKTDSLAVASNAPGHSSIITANTATSVAPGPTGSAPMSLKALIQLIKAEFEIETANFAEVIEEAMSYLSPEVQEAVRSKESVRDKAFCVAIAAGLVKP